MKIGGGLGLSKKSGTKKTPSRKKQGESKNQEYFRPISPSDTSSRSSRASSRNSLSPFTIPSDFEEYSNRPSTPPINIPPKNPKVVAAAALEEGEENFQAALSYHKEQLLQLAETRANRERYNKQLIDELKWERDMEKKIKKLLREKKKKAWMERIKKRSKIGTQQLVGGRKRKTRRRKKRKRKRTRRKGRRGVRGVSGAVF